MSRIEIKQRNNNPEIYDYNVKKLVKLGKDEFGQTVYSYRGYTVHREYLINEGWHFTALDEVHNLPKVKQIGDGYYLHTDFLYSRTLKDTLELIDEAIDY